MTLPIGLLIALIVPVACAVMSIRTGTYYYNLGVTGACVVLLLLCGQPMAYLPLIVCLLVSMVGDYFMGHQQHSHRFYLYGIVSFLLAHCCLAWFAWDKLELSTWAMVIGALLAAGYGVYLSHRILPHAGNMAMRVALCAYAAISVLALVLAIALGWPTLPRVLFALGVLMIVFSDTVISECDFAEEDRLGFLIMPTYFSCHILITAAALVALI